jgi:predicted Zn finger-like uncharacterized protein
MRWSVGVFFLASFVSITYKLESLQIMQQERWMKIHCPGCNVTHKVEYSTLPDKEVRVRCSRCKSRFSVQKVFRNKGKANRIKAVAVASDGGSNDVIFVYTNDARNLLLRLRNLGVEANKLLKYKGSLIGSKLELEKTADELSKTQAKLRMLEGEIRRIRKMSWWKRLFLR